MGVPDILSGALDFAQGFLHEDDEGILVYGAASVAATISPLSLDPEVEGDGSGTLENARLEAVVTRSKFGDNAVPTEGRTVTVTATAHNISSVKYYVDGLEEAHGMIVFTLRRQ